MAMLEPRGQRRGRRGPARHRPAPSVRGAMAAQRGGLPLLLMAAMLFLLPVHPSGPGTAGGAAYGGGMGGGDGREGGYGQPYAGGNGARMVPHAPRAGTRGQDPGLLQDFVGQVDTHACSHARTPARTPARTRSHTHAHTHAPSCRAIKACPWRHAGGGMKHLRCACVQVTKVVSRGARAFAILDGDKYLPLSDFKECPRPQGLYLRVGQWLKVVSQCPTTPPSAPDPQPSTLDPKRRRHRQHAGDACDMRVRCLHVRCI